ncbi:hypothetical protein K458DRAFT_410999 [Lentithecium fluviatile CBS 122367]|uniref:C2H2-type domain-containing protein n=1 Tax=Lentithecium fluviatile CBS 122367 TaxID=1168545 RepID=A0A6G1IC11_9PLEO|nr:hypothetical protein K458DRAFT_410999 [Lentithecium fluviatile CBS 122367]
MDINLLLNEPQNISVATNTNNKSDNPYICAKCDKRFKSKQRMDWHARIHGEEWACSNIEEIQNLFFRNVCGYCGKNLPSNMTQTEHLNNVHNYEKCDIARPFTRKDNLHQHPHHVHNAAKNFKRPATFFEEFVGSKNKTG